MPSPPDDVPDPTMAFGQGEDEAGEFAVRIRQSAPAGSAMG
ncbi:hypothetical protein [Micromonospora halophytica]|nr:hypothetical protein [Micromonospora halophytica]